MSDKIFIKGLRLVSRIGVPEEEREIPQSLAVDVRISLARSLAGIGDSLDQTVDYYAVSQKLREVAATGERQLIETLAEELAAATLGFEGVAEVRMRVQKFILSDCESVSVEITRSNRDAAK